jgi:CRISPR-associated protein Cas5t
MRVLKVVLEGVTTSFRYPHFMAGVHPSFLMPPPSTIYGHICSTLGEWIDPLESESNELAFAYHFTAEGSFEDLEHIHVLKASTGKLPLAGTEKPAKVLEGNTNPFRRTILFQPRLTLYLNRPEWEKAFHSPRYAVVLGRSQDLATYTDISVIDLVPSEQAYLEHTLLPYEMAAQTSVGIVTLMPRWIDYEHNRQAYFSRYLILQRRVMSDDLMRFKQTPFLTDPTSTTIGGRKLGLVFHTFIGGADATFDLA